MNHHSVAASLYVTLVCGRSIGTLVDSMRGNQGPVGTALGGVWENPDVIAAQKSSFPAGIWTPIFLKFHLPTLVHIPNCISIGSAVFSGLMVVYRQTDRQRVTIIH